MRQRSAGFTLLEVVLAVALLASGLALAFASARAATQVVARGEDMARRNEQMRAVENFLRTRLHSARQIAFDTDAQSLRGWHFSGEPQRMRFVADVPAYLGHGGPHLHEIALDGQGRLQLSVTLVQAGHAMPATAWASPEPLAEDLRAVRFAYRGLDAQGRLEPWRQTWDRIGSVPVQIAVEVEPNDGRPWPRLVVSPFAGSAQAHVVMP